MEKILQRFGFGLAVALSATIPVSGFAYLSPQEVFNPGQSGIDQTQSMIQTPRFDNFVQAPPNVREGEDVIAAQQQRSEALRTAAQSQLTSIDDEPTDTYVPADAPKQPSLLDNDVNYAVRQERIAAQKSDGPTIVIAGAGVTVDRNGKVLHSGAPLVTRTGPETTLGLAVMILAALSTFAFTFTRSHMTHTGLEDISLS